MSNSDPVIGMPAIMDIGKNTQYLNRAYTDAIATAGGIPVIIPLVEASAGIRSLVEDLDGILLTGSACDVEPKHYGATPDPQLGPVQPLRDMTDFALLEEALKGRMPLLAICFGMQSLNVFMGGSLIQDIDSSLQGALRHDSGEAGSRSFHTIQITPGSVLEKMAGSSQVMVNSSHHQAVDRVGRDLEVIARAPDGVVEAVTGKAADHWILGVQWHPEKSFSSDALSKKVFECFVARCRARRDDQ